MKKSLFAGKPRLAVKMYWTTAIGFLLFTALFMVLQLIFFQPYSLTMRSNQLKSEFRALYDELHGQHIDNKWMARAASFDVAHYSLTGVVEKRGKDVRVFLGERPQQAVRLRKQDDPNIYIFHTSPEAPVIPGIPTKITPIAPVTPYKEEELIPTTPASWFSPDAMRLNFVLEEKLTDMLKLSLEDGLAVELFKQGALDEKNERIWAAIAPLPEENDAERYMITVSTLQPVSDASSLLGGFYRYFYIAAIALLLGFAFLFTRMISQPLVKLNEMAKRLARLDFSARTDIKRDDEIGELAHTFDFLATELNGTMQELRSANEQLQRDIEKEKQLERLRKRFVASVSHELKTPVSLIQGYAEALRDNVGHGAKRDKYASVIVSESERMSRLVHDLLDLSQLESGKFHLQWSEVSLRMTLRIVLQTLEALTGDCRVTMYWNVPEEEVFVHSDEQRLQQILTNVLTNALRHTPSGGRVEVRVRWPQDNAGDCVQVEVYNEGEPVSEEHLPHIWDAFYRAESSGNRASGGNGIGLSIVKHLLEKHGSVYAIRNVDGGVLVTFTLPVSDAVSEE
ncbi:ATP-binding protein [Paenibacillus profundus]|uniref:histidine kinase n=1 Tax=Paenibacillus profundus TaxID=1173085 RepID=A0ABS8YF45_9BACL|nr:ATP-binding protein [Paenibacillus profundus]MCE5168667.1 ATP-binding protein [Paenibacillus profundus]